MYRLCLFLFLGVAVSAHAQTADSLSAEIRTIDGTVAGKALLSNRAMNIFLSEAAGYYMSDPDNLTLYKNSALANSADGTLAIYHNFRQPHGMDERVSSFLSMGVKADVADAFTARSEGRPYNNKFGLLVKQTWVGRPHVTATSEQLQRMEAMRTAILQSVEKAIREKAEDFRYDVELAASFAFDYAHKQAIALARTFNYQVIAFNWTSASLYVPLITENFQTIPPAGGDPSDRHAWPLHLNISHTRLWEGSKFGRLFVTLSGDMTLNNSRDGYAMTKAGNLYIGDYKTFVTPLIKGQLVYLPTDSHFGVSFLLEQAIGDYHAMNGILGFPIVLINKQAEPAVNFEFQVRWYDMGHTLDVGKGLSGRTAIGVTAGVPLSKIGF